LPDPREVQQTGKSDNLLRQSPNELDEAHGCRFPEVDDEAHTRAGEMTTTHSSCINVADCIGERLNDRGGVGVAGRFSSYNEDPRLCHSRMLAWIHT
jgi:hypothetical protein